MGSLEGISLFVREFFDREQIDSELLFTADFVLEEFFTNCVKHNPKGAGEIQVGLLLEDNELILSVADFDTDFHDPRQAKRPVLDGPLEDRQVGGLGIYLVSRMVDQLEYDYLDRQGRITVVKKL